MRTITFVFGASDVLPITMSWPVDEDCTLVSAILTNQAVLSEDPDLLDSDVNVAPDPYLKLSWFLTTSPLGLIKIPLLKGSTVYCTSSSATGGYAQMFLDSPE